MNWTAKIAIVFLCFSLCGAGAFIASKPGEGHQLRKTSVIPVKNPEVVRRIWILT
jgi:hypothetical protein